MAQKHHISPINAQLINFSYNICSNRRKSKIYHLIKNNKNLYYKFGEKTCEDIFKKSNFFSFSDEMSKLLNKDKYFIENELRLSEENASNIFLNFFKNIESNNLDLDLKENFPLLSKYLIHEWLRTDNIRKIIENNFNDNNINVSKINVKDAHLCFLDSSYVDNLSIKLLNHNNKWLFIENMIFNEYPFITGNNNIFINNEFLYYPISYKFSLFIEFSQELSILSDNFSKKFIKLGNFKWYFKKKNIKNI